jgi:hypothetical protein
MVLFPLAFVWVIVLIVWIVRNEVRPEEEQTRRWTRVRPRPPRGPRRGRPNGSRARPGARASRGAHRERR